MGTDTSPNSRSLPIKVPLSAVRDRFARAQKCMYGSPKTCDASQNPITYAFERRRMSLLHVNPRQEDEEQDFHDDPHARCPTPTDHETGTAHDSRCKTSAHGAAQSSRENRVIHFKNHQDAGSDDSDGCAMESSSSDEDEPTETLMSSEKVYPRRSPERPRRESLLTEMFHNDRVTKTTGSTRTSISSCKPPSLVWSGAAGTTPPSSVGDSEVGSGSGRRRIGALGRGRQSYEALEGGQPW